MKRFKLPAPTLAFPAWAWLVFFFLAPVGLVLYYSFGYKPGIFGTHATDRLSFDRYLEALSPTFFTVFQNTVTIALLGTAICLIIAVPVAYWMAAKVPGHLRGLLIAAIMVPYWTNFLVRTIGLQVILAKEGILSQFLQSIGLLQGTLDILYTREAVLIGVVYNYLPLMILPLYVAFDRVQGPMREAAKDLGANRFTTFFTVTLPLAGPGIVAGLLLVFIPLMGDYITPVVLGGAQGSMVGQLVASQFQTAQNWALGSAMAVLLILMIVLTAAVVALIVWLVRLPFRLRNRLVIGEAA